ncbi:MAG: 8-oxo-dGTP diphosphatase MutT [Firmicutes bacterium]|nr:8-oxo-dGTP diphosphatase MutT [Bacillota bacterium]
MKKTLEVVGAIIIKDGYVFCAKRGKNKSLAYKWEFPGGKIEKDETHEEALKREIKEELNSEINVKSFFMKITYEYDTFIINLYTYLCELKSGLLEISEHIEKKWVKKEELLSLDFTPADLPIVEELSYHLL